jgi:UDP-glucose 4-epimerase
MKILITGVSGFIGAELFDSLTKQHEVFGVSRTKLDFKNCEQLDFLKEKEVHDYFKNNQFDVIVHLASITASADSIKDIDQYLNNLKIQTNIISALKDYKSCYFINFSSTAVYPNVSDLFSETSRIDPSANPDCLYGLSKFNSEILFKFLFDQGIKLLNLRVGYVHGDRMNNTRIHKVFEKELIDTNKITIFGNGERVIPQIGVKELVTIIKQFIKNQKEGVYNLVTENCSTMSIAENIIGLNGNSESEIILVDKGNKTKFELDLDKLNSFRNV